MKKISFILILALLLNIILVPSLFAVSPEVTGFTLGVLPFLLGGASMRNEKNTLSKWSQFSVSLALCIIAGIVVINDSTNDERNKIIGGWAAGSAIGYITVYKVNF